ncbi:MAG: rhodanese-like domain-containing protein [Chromatiaceae bacterium]|nr:rhodanese-like domain-containing protein [Gammaproteobacteria bacterium]MCP5305032.1 rhodanese-like domain-containing protein [Chromatiaceae bacterium]MCP5314991.1 rhodanese-like domain-containing protein [Chromatiaceae bacterium]
MEQLIEFAGNHALLVGAFLVVLTALMWHVATDPGGKDAIDPLGATALINHENAVVLDVRSMAEFKDGHIVNAVNVPLNGLGNNLKQLEKHRAKPIVAVCRSGSRSGAACRMLRKQGFEHVKNLRGGMLAWENANLPVKRR